MASSNVPKFGNWEDEEDVPYTAYFEKARKVRTSGGKMTNPNDHEEETSDLYSKPEQEEPVKTSRDSGESKRQGKSVSQNNSYEKSPLHNHAKASPNKNSYDGSGKSKPRSDHKSDETPEKGAVLPKFGDWDESNSSSADGYTNIFNQVRQERTSSSNVIGSSRTPTHSSDRNTSDQTKFCCFSWGGK